MAHLHQKVLGSNNGSCSDSVEPQQGAPAARLSNRQRDEIVHQAGAHDPVRSKGAKTETNTGQDLDEATGVGVVTNVECCGGVVKEIEHTDTSKSLEIKVSEFQPLLCST